ncbi:class I SAM-dependent methyltransferase [Actinotalea sp. BY-33]|uniref:Class I SAM-dependent methyltransferase n=1 Tax=Actinotalea soli TaxID=2819234 RepID=A0A939LRT2_9CELL|nr:class I SAM-dependent methyltransferase [Actinotalea soli]MBO1750964.1 class I SAM-dependent methyltransferase [Actinotalea soli]
MSQYHLDSVDPTEPNTSHAVVLDLVGTVGSVLDVGCSTGYLGAELRRRGCRVVGVEQDADAAGRAREVLDEVLVADIEGGSLTELLAGQQFDVVVLADVLEHLRDPAATLRAATELLAPGGSVVISVPNVAHGSLRLALLQGRWIYTETGLLDRTHLRFFTRDSFLGLLDDAGLAPTDLRATVLDPLASEVPVDDEALPGAVVDWVRRQPDALHYQFVARAQPSLTRGRPVELVRAVDPPPVVDAHTERAERESSLAQLPADVEAQLAQVVDLRRRVLTARDHAIGAEAAVNKARVDAELAEAAAEEAHLRYATAMEELAEVKESRTWVAGRRLLAPVTVARRLLGRR